MAESEEEGQRPKEPSFGASNFFKRRKRKKRHAGSKPAADASSHVPARRKRKRGLGTHVPHESARQEGPVERPAPAPAPSLPGWDKKRFGAAAPAAEQAPAMSAQMNWLEGAFKKHPFRSLSALALILLLIVFDVALLFGRFSATEWVMINFVPNSPIARLGKDRRENTFAAAARTPEASQEAALARATATLYGLWNIPAQPASIKGILSTKETKELARVKGVRDMTLTSLSSFFEQPTPAENLGRTILLAEGKTARSPYGPAYDAAESSRPFQAAGLDRKSAHKGEAMNQIVPEKDFAGTAPADEYSEIPEGDTGEEVLDQLLAKNEGKVAAFIKQHGWKRHHHQPDPDMPKVPENGLGKSWATWQLLEALRLNNRATNCGTCSPENRLNKGRAEFFGEKR